MVTAVTCSLAGRQNEPLHPTATEQMASSCLSGISALVGPGIFSVRRTFSKQLQTGCFHLFLRHMRVTHV
ncbi:hypothetical protein ATANTOWER_001134 [Ataeniobius toweri]|uniref:Uncharacterized protein n=1 Tax=Ataeniobius toweri TaxID=208326 RepID=A0ABU7B6L2_9TELE|nr:hypothetical protein [Ataeniobius toweri]